MLDYQRIREASQKAKGSLGLRIDSQIDEAFGALIDVCEEEFPDGEKLSAEAMIAQLEVMALMIVTYKKETLLISVDIQFS